MSPFFLQQFELWLARRGNRSSTAAMRVANLRFFYSQNDTLSYETATQFLSKCLDNKRKKETLNKYIIAFRHYTAFLKETSLPFDEKIFSIKQFTPQPTQKPGMTDEEISKILSLPPLVPGRATEYAMWTDFFTVLAYTGARPHEISTLTPDRVNAAQKFIFVPESISKTNTARYIPIHDYIMPILARRMQGKREDELLFTYHGKQLDRRYWFHFFKIRLTRLGIYRKRVSLYSLRHSALYSIAADDNINAFRIRDLAGHKSIKTTEHYVRYNVKTLHSTLEHLSLLQDKLTPEAFIKSIREYFQKLRIPPNVGLTIEDKGNNLKIEVAKTIPT